MAEKNPDARRRFARIASICGLFLLSMIFAALPVAADKHGGSGGSGDNAAMTGQRHDGDDQAKDMNDNDANEHQGVMDNDANAHHDMMNNDADDHGAVDNDADDDHGVADNDANDNDEDDVPLTMGMAMPLSR
jgi:hypothetical protein